MAIQAGVEHRHEQNGQELKQISSLTFFAQTCGLIVKAVANFSVDFARVVVVKAAEGEAVVEQDAAVG